jgi:PHD-finger
VSLDEHTWNVLNVSSTMKNHAAATATNISTKLDVPSECTASSNKRMEGCYLCHLNDHQDQILLCEYCNGEYHTYCLQPPLESVPDYDWYCGM